MLKNVLKAMLGCWYTYFGLAVSAATSTTYCFLGAFWTEVGLLIGCATFAYLIMRRAQEQNGSARTVHWSDLGAILVLFGLVLHVFFGGVSGFGGVFAIFFTFILLTALTLSFVGSGWPAGDTGDTIIDVLWGRPEDPTDLNSPRWKFLKLFPPIMLVEFGLVALVLLVVGLASLVGTTPAASGSAFTAAPTAATSSPYITLTPSASAAAPTPAPSTPAASAAAPTTSAAADTCGAPTMTPIKAHDSQFTPTGVDVCLNNQWVQWTTWTQAAPATVTVTAEPLAQNPNKPAGQYLYYQLTYQGATVTIRAAS